MASKDIYTSDKELTSLYNLLDKDALVRLLIEKYRQLDNRNYGI
jgi:hypothetical protein